MLKKIKNININYKQYGNGKDVVFFMVGGKI